MPAFGSILVAQAAYPAGLAAAPDGRIFYSELYQGRIRVLRADGTVDPVPWANVNADFGIEWTSYYHGGLSGIAFSPTFAEDGHVYVVTQVPGEDGVPIRSMVVRYRERDGRGTDPHVLLEVRAGRFENIYSLVFGPDGMLYVPSGWSRGRAEGVDPLGDLLGKILRLRPDGSVPPDNPFGASAPLVWAQGIRNAFDIAFLPDSNLILAGENGAADHDEIDLIIPGHDYGWPAHEGATDAAGITSPLLDYGDQRVAPAGITYYQHDRFPQLSGTFLMCHNHGPGLFALRLDADDPGRLASMTRIADRCSLDVITLDGEVYFSDPTGIYRLVAG
jgi:glucose/arabinose dehydrogenase